VENPFLLGWSRKAILSHHCPTFLSYCLIFDMSLNRGDLTSRKECNHHWMEEWCFLSPPLNSEKVFAITLWENQKGLFRVPVKTYSIAFDVCWEIWKRPIKFRFTALRHTLTCYPASSAKYPTQLTDTQFSVAVSSPMRPHDIIPVLHHFGCKNKNI